MQSRLNLMVSEKKQNRKYTKDDTIFNLKLDLSDMNEKLQNQDKYMQQIISMKKKGVIKISNLKDFISILQFHYILMNEKEVSLVYDGEKLIRIESKYNIQDLAPKKPFGNGKVSID